MSSEGPANTQFKLSYPKHIMLLCMLYIPDILTMWNVDAKVVTG